MLMPSEPFSVCSIKKRGPIVLAETCILHSRSRNPTHHPVLCLKPHHPMA